MRVCLSRQPGIPFTPMAIIADMHAHIHPSHNWRHAVARLRRNLRRLSPDATCVAFVTECWGQHALRDLAEARIAIPDEIVSRFSGHAAVRICGKSGPPVFFLPARQVATAERLEVLALGVDGEIPDRVPTSATVRSVLEAGGIPVLTWAAGKWLFSRGSVANRLLSQFSPDQLYFGDTSLRPRGWPSPALMRRARDNGFKLLVGSDPLPFSGEEKYLGTYASLFDGDLNAGEPMVSMLRIIRETNPSTRGARCSALEAAYRLARHFLIRT